MLTEIIRKQYELDGPEGESGEDSSSSSSNGSGASNEGESSRSASRASESAAAASAPTASSAGAPVVQPAAVDMAEADSNIGEDKEAQAEAMDVDSKLVEVALTVNTGGLVSAALSSASK